MEKIRIGRDGQPVGTEPLDLNNSFSEQCLEMSDVGASTPLREIGAKAPDQRPSGGAHIFAARKMQRVHFH